jgi:TetR/AcrR family fatty acid metabolism transcriptional regulator
MSDIGSAQSVPHISSHDRILMAAKRLFARNGYENTSTVAIARDAGTSESQLMKHFGSKQGLLVAIFERGWAGMGERMRNAQNAGSPAEKLLAVLETIVIELENDHDLKTLMMLESRRVRKDNRDVLLSQGFQQIAAAVDEILREMRQQGEIRGNVNLDAVRAAYLGLTEGLLRDQVLAERSGFQANYGFDDVRQVLEMMVPALSAHEERLKAVSE